MFFNFIPTGQSLDSLILHEILIYILFSLVITNIVIGALILFSISIVDFSIFNTIRFMFTNGVKKVAKGVGAFVGSAAVTGVDSGLNLYGKYLNYIKNNSGVGGSNSNSSSNSNSNSSSNSNSNSSSNSNSNTSSTQSSGSTPVKSSLLLWALSYLNINVAESSSDMFKNLSSILTLELIVLAGFINLLF